MTNLAETDAYYAELGGFSYSDEQVDRWLQRWFVPWFRLVPGLRVLDLCCGDGVWSFGLLRLETDLFIEGVELSSGAVVQANARAEAEGHAEHARFGVQDAEESLPFPGESFDLIFARGLFVFNQHSMLRPATLTLLESWHRLLAPGGIFFAAYGSKPEYLESYTPPEKTVLPMNFEPRQTSAVDFRGGKYNHTVESFAAPFKAAPGVRILRHDYLAGRHTLLSRRVGDEVPTLTLALAHTRLLENQSFTIHIFPPWLPVCELELRGEDTLSKESVAENFWKIADGLKAGHYSVRVRYLGTDWSRPLDIEVKPMSGLATVQPLREVGRQRSPMAERDTR